MAIGEDEFYPQRVAEDERGIMNQRVERLVLTNSLSVSGLRQVIGDKKALIIEGFLALSHYFCFAAEN